MTYDFSSAALSDRITRTIDYYAVSQRILKFGERRSWKLIESLATDLAAKVLLEFGPEKVAVEVKKFPIPEARYVSVTVSKEAVPLTAYKSRWWRW
jgi:dihydroneopterin aldolase